MEVVSMSRRTVTVQILLLWVFFPGGVKLRAAERPVDPTFLHRYLPDAPSVTDRVCLKGCRYRPLFGDGDSQPGAVGGIARFGRLELDPQGASTILQYPEEEQVYFVIEGKGALVYGESRVPLGTGEFVYVPPGISHSLQADNSGSWGVLVMGYRITPGTDDQRLAEPQKAATRDAVPQTVAGHPDSTRYLLLMGDVTSQRDLLATGQLVTSLFIMEFDPGGTNQPHHHLTEEEIYLVLEGRGEMVAGGGMDGIEGRHAARAGDAYYFRPNCTAGFYADPDPSAGTARILAIRSRYPGLD
jgi:mannose-6-phosphate isomerase-like protein (cupin superfamily)